MDATEAAAHLNLTANVDQFAWDAEHTIKLIKAYQSQNVLWDANNRGHIHRNARKDAWSAVAKIMQMQQVDIKKKMNSLIAVFRSQHRKGVTKLRWWAKYMEFLQPQPSNTAECVTRTLNFVKYSENSSGSVSNKSEFLDMEGHPDPFMQTRKRPFQTAFQEFRAEFEQENRSVDREASQVNIKLNLKTDNNLEIDSEDEFVEENSIKKDISAGSNDIDLYVQHLACKLRKYSPQIQSAIQFQFNQILNDADMGRL